MTYSNAIIFLIFSSGCIGSPSTNSELSRDMGADSDRDVSESDGATDFDDAGSDVSADVPDADLLEDLVPAFCNVAVLEHRFDDEKFESGESLDWRPGGTSMFSDSAATFDGTNYLAGTDAPEWSIDAGSMYFRVTVETPDGSEPLPMTLFQKGALGVANSARLTYSNQRFAFIVDGSATTLKAESEPLPTADKLEVTIYIQWESARGIEISVNGTNSQTAGDNVGTGSIINTNEFFFSGPRTGTSKGLIGRMHHFMLFPRSLLPQERSRLRICENRER